MSSGLGSGLRFLVICGGTGGHLAPGIATAEALTARGAECLLVISRKQIDQTLVAGYPELRFTALPGAALSLRPDRLFRSLPAHCGNLRQSRALLRSFQPNLILAFGGFLSLGAVAGSLRGRTRLALHEANRVPGRAIRMLRRFADRIYLPEGISLEGVGPERIRHFGYPVRAAFANQPGAGAREALGVPTSGPLLAVIGGSQGAQALNQWAAEAFPALADAGIHLFLVTGPGKGDDAGTVREGGSGQPVHFRSRSFCDRIDLLLNAADLVVSRAGAGSIAELTRCRTPSLLVPYPHAADQHQLANARFHEEQGGCLVIEEGGLDGLTAEVLSLLGDRSRLDRMATALAAIEARQRIPELYEDLLSLASPG